MSAHAGVCVLITMVIVVGQGAPDSSSTWMRSQPQQQQSLHGLLVSIDERLQTLENVRWELTLKQTEQRLDSLESSIRRLDSNFQDRLDKFERTLNSKELKDELTVEKLTHKIRDVMDSNYDRYNRRLGYTEERLEMVLQKMQMTTEASLSRLEKQQEDVQTEILDAVTLLEDLKSQSSITEDKLNNSHKAIQQHIQKLISPSNEELQKISGSLEHLGSRLNSSLTPVGTWSNQNDGPPSIDVVTSLRREISSEGTKLATKINNMYNDMWRRVVSVETLIKDLNRIANKTQREVLEEVRSLVLPDHREFPGDSQENFLEVALDALERKLQRRLLDLGHKVEDRLDTLSATQNLVMDSCLDGGICHGLESRLSQVLEKIFVVFSGKIEGFSNRTLDLDTLVMEMMELVKSQHSHLLRTVTHNTNMVVTLAKESSDANKLLHHSVTQLAEKTDYNFQELHDDVQEILNTSGKICVDNEKLNEDVVGQQIIPDILSKNNTDNKTVLSSTTETTVPTSEPTNITVKPHDAGVLKITKDDIKPLRDNSNNTAPSATTLKPVSLKPSHPLTLDSSILQVIELMTSNFTQNQKDTLLRFLNTTISLDNLEAVIQNTEAERDDETSVEIYDPDTLHKTEVEEESTITGNERTKPVSTDISVEAENGSDDNNDDLIQSETTAAEVVAIMNSTRQIGNETEGKLNPNIDIKISGISEDLKTQLRYYTLIMKIKRGDLNITEFWKPLHKFSNLTGDENRQNLLPSIEKLCYGEENIQSFASDHTNSKMRQRLLLINQMISDKTLYEKIENICNAMTESLLTEDISESILRDTKTHAN